ncbi:hypothetical protein VAT7223_02783 [Vibrio atlanticus]|uniref:Uncharacterized protein n=1 Tax=Vibrio atlanticus TaxID=693153 RepID=A0A1C3IW36_9VIBR|nr:hypothetical protein VAT7223_02783 [Vibrio atlanticus]
MAYLSNEVYLSRKAVADLLIDSQGVAQHILVS